MNRGKRPTDGGQALGHHPFVALGGPDQPAGRTPIGKEAPVPARNRGRVEIRRSTAGRGGKTVTVVSAFIGIGLPEKEELAKQMRARCGCGGTVKDGRIEIQGDKRDMVAEILREAGFRPVFAGG